MGGHRRRGALAGLALVAAALTACGSDPVAQSPAASAARGVPGAEPVAPGSERATTADLQVTKVAQLPAMLTSFAAHPGGRELVVGSRQGVLRRLVRTERDGATVPVVADDPILDLSAEVSTLGERGAFDAAFVGDGRWLVVNYTAQDGTITVERFPYEEGEPIDRADGQVLMALPHPYSWHHGGGLALEAGGDLYVGIGDMEFRQIDPPGPQDPNLVLGGVLRIPAEQVTAATPDFEALPSDMVARGMRNPWRISFDQETGDLWIGDVGLADVEEVDLIPARDLAGEPENFGWPYLEGSRANQGQVPGAVEVTPPILERGHDTGACGMVAGTVYRGRNLPGLAGRFVYGDLCDLRLRAFTPDGTDPGVDDGPIATLEESIVSLGADRAGELYLLGSQGGLYRLDPSDWQVPANEQAPAGAVESTTTVPRSTDACDLGHQVVSAVQPLADIGSMSPSELEASVTAAVGELQVAVTTLPSDLQADGYLVLEVFTALRDELAGAGWEPAAQSIDAIRDEAYTGTGRFLGFPDAMARLVDSECG